MDSEDTYRAALVRAADALGGVRALADRLQVPMADLTRWLAGAGAPSIGTFLKVVDILIEARDKPAFLAAATGPRNGLKKTG